MTSCDDQVEMVDESRTMIGSDFYSHLEKKEGL